jgi:hypothetical protein
MAATAERRMVLEERRERWAWLVIMSKLPDFEDVAGDPRLQSAPACAWHGRSSLSVRWSYANKHWNEAASTTKHHALDCPSHAPDVSGPFRHVAGMPMELQCSAGRDGSVRSDTIRMQACANPSRAWRSRLQAFATSMRLASVVWPERVTGLSGQEDGCRHEWEGQSKSHESCRKREARASDGARSAELAMDVSHRRRWLMMGINLLG